MSCILRHTATAAPTHANASYGSDWAPTVFRNRNAFSATPAGGVGICPLQVQKGSDVGEMRRHPAP